MLHSPLSAAQSVLRVYNSHQIWEGSLMYGLGSEWHALMCKSADEWDMIMQYRISGWNQNSPNPDPACSAASEAFLILVSYQLSRGIVTVWLQGPSSRRYVLMRRFCNVPLLLLKINTNIQRLYRRQNPATGYNPVVSSLYRGQEKLKHSQPTNDPDKKTLRPRMVSSIEQAMALSANHSSGRWITQHVFA